MFAGPTRPFLSPVAGIALLVVGSVGLLDALIGEVWDLAILFGLVALTGLVGLLVAATGRRSVTLRADLAAALQQRARRGGESVDQVVDRSVATYLDALEDPGSAPR